MSLAKWVHLHNCENSSNISEKDKGWSYRLATVWRPNQHSDDAGGALQAVVEDLLLITPVEILPVYFPFAFILLCIVTTAITFTVKRIN